MKNDRPVVRVYLWLIVCAALGLSLVVLFDDGCQQDGGLHFLFAKWAWQHPALFVGVWTRPLYTFCYAFPALLGYRATRLFTVLICLEIARQTWRLAEDLKLKRAPLAIILVWLQPSFFLFSADNMTEPIFALVFVIALRLHHRGYVTAGMFTASLLILARPEGFFLGLLWAAWVVIDQSKIQNPKSSIRALPLLAAGSFIWWLAAWLMTGDPLFIKHNWPANWPMTGTVYGAAGLFAYPLRLPEIVGFFLFPVFCYGLFLLIKRRELFTLTSSFLLIFILHTVFRAFGLLGSAGYPRYLVAVAPAIALITLVGWNELAKLFAHTSRMFRSISVAVLIVISIYTNFVYADGAEWARDARAVNEIHAWFQTHPQPITRLIWSKPYACILFDRDPWENLEFTKDRETDLKLLRESPAGTLAVWDERIGPSWFGLTARDFEVAGFVELHSRTFLLRGYLLDRPWLGFGGPRRQTFYLFYKPEKIATEERDRETRENKRNTRN